MLRPLVDADLPAVAELFFAAVRRINVRDYTPAQVAAWAPEPQSSSRWRQRLEGQEVLVADGAGQVVGFCSWTGAGYIDFLYVHPDHVGRGVASRLYAAVEAALRARGLSRIEVHVSVTAEPFFLRRGYRLVRRQLVLVRGVELGNAVMEKMLL